MHLVVDGVVTVDGGCYPVGNDPVGGFDPKPLQVRPRVSITDCIVVVGFRDLPVFVISLFYWVAISECKPNGLFGKFFG